MADSSSSATCRVLFQGGSDEYPGANTAPEEAETPFTDLAKDTNEEPAPAASSSLPDAHLYSNASVVRRADSILHHVDGALKCTICCDIFNAPVVIASGQTYCEKCILHWFKLGKDVCPSTRQKLRNKDIIPNYAVRALIDKRLDQLGVIRPSAKVSVISSQRATCFSSCNICRIRPMQGQDGFVGSWVCCRQRCGKECPAHKGPCRGACWRVIQACA